MTLLPIISKIRNMLSKGFSYRLYPTKKQARQLSAQLEECRWLYNKLLEGRKVCYDRTGRVPSLYDQMSRIVFLKELRPSLENVYAQCLQNVAIRIDLAFQAFFRRIKTGKKPGYPRFKQFGRYDSITFSQAPNGCKIRDGMLRLSKIGSVKILLHRKLEGKPKTCTIRRSSTGKWYASFSCEVPTTPDLPLSNKQVGIDVGLSTFASMSDGSKIKRKRFFKTDEKALAKAQKKLSRCEKDTPERVKARKPVSRIHERIKFRRHNFAHQTSRKIINKYDFIAVEDLEINRMIENKRFSKSISDGAWSLFFTLLLYKAAEAGRTVVRVNPAYTSQTCSSCGHRQRMPVEKRVYKCGQCGLQIDRDLNAALNILKIGLGQHAVGPIPKRPRLRSG